MTRTNLCILLLLGLGSVLAVPSAASATPLQNSREQAGLAEEQELLLQQLRRLIRTMEVLQQRFEAEQRTQAAKLLREGIDHLGLRDPETGLLTLDELMNKAREDIAAGQTFSSLQRQERVIDGITRLLSILMDRKDVEDLDKSLKAIQDLKTGLSELAAEEQKLQEDTAALRDASANEEQKELQKNLAQIAAQQRELLAQTEAKGRDAGTFDLERIERELAKLIQNQETDVNVLRAWQPDEQSSLQAIAPLLDGARTAAERAERLKRAADKLRATERAMDRGEDPGELARTLEEASQREALHERASGDEAAKRAAAALDAAAKQVREATEASTAEAQAALENAATVLEQQARAENAKAASAAKSARDKAAELAKSPTAAGQTAKAVEEALENADRDENPQTLSPEERIATEEAVAALRRGLSDMEFLPQAVSAAQENSAEEAKRLEEALERLPKNSEADTQAAADELAAAAEAMREAGAAAAQRESEKATASAEAAQARLEAAQAALSKAIQAQANSNASQPPGGKPESTPPRANTPPSGSPNSEQSSPDFEELAQKQAELANELERLEQNAEQGSMTPEAQEQVGQALEQAREAMQQASEQLSQGRSSSSASSQREALQAMSEAAQQAEEGVTPQTPEQEARAEELARKQEEIRKKLLELAKRNEERENSQPLPSLQKAAQSASEAEQSLEQGDLSQAEKQEEQAEREIQEALEDLEEEEEQYQNLREEELLFQIKQEVEALIENHQKQMAETVEVDTSRAESARISRAQRLRLRRIAREEGALAARAGELATALSAEKSVVFAEVLNNSSEDLLRIERDLGERGDYESGDRIQALQGDVLQNLEWLVEALSDELDRREQEEQGEQDGGSGGSPGENRLVPDAAELKLLRRLELDNLEQIDELLIIHPELLDDGGPIDELLLRDIARLGHRHERTSKLFQQFRARLGIPDPDADPIAEGMGLNGTDNDEQNDTNGEDNNED